ncbi:hypothetical protein [Bacillus cereus]
MDAQYISDQISRALTNKDFHDHEDDVSRHGPRCKGNERWIDGNIGVPGVSGTLDGMTYTGIIKFQYSAKYRSKHFPGVLCEYKTDKKDCTGEIEAGIRLSLLGQAITSFNVLSSDPSTAHDSTRMCTEALQSTLLETIRNLG